ncbi:hypothetical protein GCM10027612_16760 [Microbispora bryophytorum subsp. camponoti]
MSKFGAVVRFMGEKMPKCPNVVGFLMLGTVLSGGAVPLGIPAVAASAGDAVVTGPGGDHPGAGDHTRAHGRNRAGQHDKQQQSGRQQQNMLHDVTLALTPMQKGQTDSRAMPYNWQKTDTIANSSSDQNSLSDLTNRPAQKSDSTATGDTSDSTQKSDRPVTSPATSPAMSSAPQDAAASAEMLAYLRNLAAKKQFTGSALVVRHGRVLARFAAGEADESRTSPTGRTRSTGSCRSPSRSPR